MARINVLGGTGHAGAAVVREAAKRGHAVRSYSRNPPSTTVEGVDYAIGSLLDPQHLAGAVEDVDVVFETMSPRGDMAGRLEGVLDELITHCARAGVRLGVLGGASSLLVADGGPRLFDVSDPAPEVLPEIRTGLALLERLRSAPEALDWFYVSPPERFGAWEPEDVTGQYRVSDDILLRDDTGDSYISGADLAVAVVDEVERPRHHRQRFHVAH